MNTHTTQAKANTLRSIRAGDRVTILVPNGQRINWQSGTIEQEWKESAGRAVMRGALPDSWVLNMGGRFGTPGVATVDNIVRVRKGRQ